MISWESDFEIRQEIIKHCEQKKKKKTTTNKKTEEILVKVINTNFTIVGKSSNQ